MSQILSVWVCCGFLMAATRSVMIWKEESRNHRLFLMFLAFPAWLIVGASLAVLVSIKTQVEGAIKTINGQDPTI